MCSGFLVWSKDITEIFKVSASAYCTLLSVENPSWNTVSSSADPKNSVAWVTKELPKTLCMQFKKKNTIQSRKPCFPSCNGELLKFRNCCCYFTFYSSLEAAFKGPPKLSRGEVVGWMLLGAGLRDVGRNSTVRTAYEKYVTDGRMSGTELWTDTMVLTWVLSVRDCQLQLAVT